VRHCPSAPSGFGAGAGSVVVGSPAWRDIVDLSIREVLEADPTAPQVTRRLTALLHDLLADLPADRHPPLLRYRRRLRTAAAKSTDCQEAGPRLVGDRQGIGRERRTMP
jgi:hypothetical protein